MRAHGLMILAKAIRDELALTEANLARREGRANEPFSALLERTGGGGRTKAAETEGAGIVYSEQYDE